MDAIAQQQEWDPNCEKRSGSKKKSGASRRKSVTIGEAKYPVYGQKYN
jgi:hypothetical protein